MRSRSSPTVRGFGGGDGSSVSRFRAGGSVLQGFSGGFSPGLLRCFRFHSGRHPGREDGSSTHGA
jgi:hypothetical protein